MKSILALGTVFTSALAAPLVSWSPALGEFYAAIDRHIQIARQDGPIGNPPTCDLSKAVQPIAPTPLPVPDPAWKLTEVVVGRGVQVSTALPYLPETQLTYLELHLLLRLRRRRPKTNRRHRIPLQRLLHSSKLPRHPLHAPRPRTPICPPR